MPQQPKYHFQKAPYLGFVAENNCCHLHLHRQVELSYITDGEQTFTIDGTDYHLTAGDLVIVFPNQLHRLDTPVYAKAITSIFDPNLTEDYTRLLTAFHFDSCVFHKDELDTSTLAALNELAKTGISKSYKMHAVPFAEKGWLTVVLGDLFYKHPLQPRKEKLDLLQIRRLSAYMREHLSDISDTDTKCRELGISRHYLTHTLKQEIYVNHTTFLTLLRLEHADELLFNSNLRLIDIALECGFGTVQTFTRNYKKAAGITPAAVRELCDHTHL